MVNTIDRSTAEPPPASLLAHTVVGEKRVTLHGLDWHAYQTILHALPQSRSARLTYDRGVLEISVPLEIHEFSSELISVFIRILVVELKMKVRSMRSTTLDRIDLDRGAEPDNAYYIQNQPNVKGRKIDLNQDPAPDLIVEVDITHTDIEKTKLYASLGVPELWRFNGRVWQIFQLENQTYQEVFHSPTFPTIEKEDLYRFLAEAQDDEVEAEINFRQFLRDRKTED